MPRGLAYKNPPPDKNNTMSGPVPKDVAKREFASRLQAAMDDKGWTQSELARRAEKFLRDGKSFNRDNVSNYVAGKSMPATPRLLAMCKALGLEPDALVPFRTVPSAGDSVPPLDVRDLGEGDVFLRINQRVSWEKALIILNTLKGVK